MRILFCTCDGAGAFNGINAWLLDFLPNLVTSGHHLEVLVFAWSPASECHTYSRLRALGIDARLIFPMLYSEPAARLCIREVLRTKADIFVANMITPALLAMPSIRRLGVACISILHNDDDEYRAKASFRSDATVVISRGLLKLVPSDGRIVRCIPYGITTPTRSATVASPDAPFRLIYHGRIANLQKRIGSTAIALTKACRSNARLSADIYGSGPDEAGLLEQLAIDDAGGRVRYLGPRPITEIRKLLPDYHVAVLLSDFEGLGLSILESMAAGLVPVCLRTASGLPDLVRPGETGCFVLNREKDFVHAINNLAADPDQWLRLSQGARALVRTEFSEETCLRSWNDLLENLLSRPVPAHVKRASDMHEKRLAPPLSALALEDYRYPGLPRALWRWLRFGPRVARRPW